MSFIRDIEVLNFDEEDFDNPSDEMSDIHPEIRREGTENSSGKNKKDEKKPSVFSEIMSWVVPFAVALAVVFVLKTYIIINAEVPTGSMENTIMTGDNLIGFRLSYQFADPQRGDIIIFNAPDAPSQKYIKRIIGMPGDTVTIDDAKVYINGKELDEPYLKEAWVVKNDDMEYVVPSGCYFVMGDNRNTSEDARYWTNTYVTRESILGKAVVIYWPVNHIGKL